MPRHINARFAAGCIFKLMPKTSGFAQVATASHGRPHCALVGIRHQRFRRNNPEADHGIARCPRAGNCGAGHNAARYSSNEMGLATKAASPI
jgi:hypothetical protein